MSLRIGIDIGTSGVRTAVIDEMGNPLSSARAAHEPQHGSRLDASKWWDAVAKCLSAQITALKAEGYSASEVSGIAVDGTSGSMVLTDRSLTPVSPALMYNSSGFHEEAAAIARLAPSDHITRGSNSALARAMRLVGTARSKPALLLHQADFIAAKLLGLGGHSDFNNTLKTGFDPETEAWPDWISDLIDPGLLPSPSPIGKSLGPISTRTADEFGLPKTAEVFPGTTDSIAAFLAAAPLEEGAAVTSLGSTLAVKCLSATRIDDPSIGLYSHKVGDVWVAGGASNTGGAVLAHFFNSDALAELSQGIDPLSESDLDYYPLLQPGERFPTNDPKLEPRLSPRPSDDAKFLQGLLESMARIEAASYRAIEDRGGTYPSRVFTAGGGAKNRTWTKIRERILGLKIVPADSVEAAVGAARLAG